MMKPDSATLASCRLLFTSGLDAARSRRAARRGRGQAGLHRQRSRQVRAARRRRPALRRQAARMRFAINLERRAARRASASARSCSASPGSSRTTADAPPLTPRWIRRLSIAQQADGDRHHHQRRVAGHRRGGPRRLRPLELARAAPRRHGAARRRGRQQQHRGADLRRRQGRQRDAPRRHGQPPHHVGGDPRWRDGETLRAATTRPGARAVAAARHDDRAHARALARLRRRHAAGRRGRSASIGDIIGTVVRHLRPRRSCAPGDRVRPHPGARAARRAPASPGRSRRGCSGSSRCRCCG